MPGGQAAARAGCAAFDPSRPLPVHVFKSVAAGGQGGSSPRPLAITQVGSRALSDVRSRSDTKAGFRHAPDLDMGEPSPRVGNRVYSRTLDLQSRVRRLVPDGRGGMLALTERGVARLSPDRADLLPVGREQGVLPRAAAVLPEGRVAAARTPGDLFVAVGTGGQGELARFGRDATKVWCVALPVEPLDVAVTASGAAWLLGRGQRDDLAVRVSPAGGIVATYALARGAAKHLAVDAAGSAWLACGRQGAVKIGADGRIGRTSLPAPAQRAFPTPDGGIWAVGGGLATRLDARGTIVARYASGFPPESVAGDDTGRLWIAGQGAVLEVDGTGVTRHPIEGKVLRTAVQAVSEGRRQLWLLGPDRRSVSIVELPCDCH